MASLQQADFLARLKALLPASWFADEANVLGGYLSGFANLGAAVWGWLEYALAQTRIATASGRFLDLIAWDFFGARFRRRASQADDVFRKAIVAEILRPRTTRQGMEIALENLTGAKPIIFEPADPRDAAVYGSSGFAWSVKGRWGSLAHPFECFIDVQRPLGQGIRGISGYGSTADGYGTGRKAYVSLSQMAGPVTDAMIYATVNDTRAAGTIAWTRISDALPPPDLAPAYTYLADEDDAPIVMPDGSPIIVSGPV